MCGIVGYCGSRAAAPILLESLGRMEYRGYDSAGIALMSDRGLFVERRAGKLINLRTALEGVTPLAHTGIGHTRWATHGAPTDLNAHPHRDCSGRLVVVHNGIIENYVGLRAELLERGHTLGSETDTEVIAHLLEEQYDGDLRAALLAVLPRLDGAFALVVAHADEPGRLLGTRQHAPLVAGFASGEGFLASDPLAIAGSASRVVYLAEGDVVDLHADRLAVCDRDGQRLERPSEPLELDLAAAGKGGHAHYMRKEMFEQPNALRQALVGRVRDGRIVLPEIEKLAESIRGASRIEIVACGTAHYASMIAARLIERWSGVTTRTTVASEFRYNAPRLGADVIVIAVSQSGETADTLAATRLAQAAGSPVIALVNAAGSSLAREADATVLLQAGPEIAVAATKSYTAQATIGVVLAARIAMLRGVLSAEKEGEIARALVDLPAQAELALEWSEDAVALAHEWRDAAGFLYLGRGAGLPAAFEGALKIKEISYVHADGYPAGELKHGPIALLEPSRPIVAVATGGATREKLLSNLMEGRARGARIIAVVEHGSSALDGIADAILRIPACDEEFSPILAVIPLQRFAYEHAVVRGLDVDQPRNLAKSVTVE